MAFHQLPELDGPFFVVVVGDGDAIDAPCLDLGHYLLGNAQGRRLETESLPDVSMEVQLNLHI
jgi:hypothetical protein